ncbi:MAG: 50S ribosomal protein L29 [Deltaproteobacteria bacterium]|nr:50S ribosomal protein L29 [Deltaproteobacteria bacterium]MBW2529923.1 50S ribosomal protein L29 [Deltaproteobacteria bacterium]
MKTEQLRECTDERLAELDKSLRREIFESRIKNFTNQLDDTASIRRARRDLARVKTIQNERALQQDRQVAEAPEGTDEP